MKKTYSIIIFSFAFLFVLGTSFNIFYIHTPSAFQSEKPRNSAEEVIIYSPENKTYSKPMDGYYPSAYGFENDVTGTNPQNWGTNEDSNTYIQVEEAFNGHKKVLSFLDQSGTGNCESWRDLVSQTNGYVEYWVAVENTATVKLVTLTLRDGGVYGTVAFGLTVRDDYINPWTSSDHVCDMVAQQWYHIRLEFDCSTDIGDIYINGIYNSSYSFVTDVSSIDCLRIETSAGDSSPEKVYFDAFGASWDVDYSQGDNMNEGLLLDYDVSVSSSWLGYSLDLSPNITIFGDTTIPFPNTGLHKIQIHGDYPNSSQFTSEVRYFTVDPSYIPPINIATPTNTTYLAPMDGYYPSAYGFENDISGANPQNWGTNEDGNTYIQIEEEFSGHKKVLSFLDQSGTGNCESWRDIGSQTNGYVEYWVAVENTATVKLVTLTLRDGGVYGTVAFGLTVRDDYINPWTSSDHVCDMVAQQWYHIRLEFDCSTDIGDIYINGIYNSSYPFNTDVSSIDCLRIETSAGDSSPEKVYFDAFGASWDIDYSQGDNTEEGLLLSYSTPEVPDWQAYSLDGGTIRTIFGNITIKMPNDGYHYIQVYANDSENNFYESEIRYFATLIKQNPSSPTPEIPGYDIYLLIGILSVASVILIRKKIKI